MNNVHKLYRLKKDTPFAKVGTVFSLKHGVLESRGTVFTFRLHKSSIADFGDWFEKISVDKPWVPRHGDMYLYLDDRGDLSKSINVNVRSDTHRIATGNCYRENTPESVIIKEQRFIPEALNILITEAKKEWYVHTGLLEPDFNDWAQPKYYPVYSMSEQRFIVEEATKYVSFGIYLPTKESCKQLINIYEYQLKLVMGVDTDL